MELADDLELDPVRCAVVHRGAEVDPAGTAPVWDAVLVVEVPLPWPRDISLVEPFASLVAANVSGAVAGETAAATITGADGRTWRPQGVVPQSSGEGSRRAVRVMALERTVDGSGPFHRREWVLPGGEPDRVVALGAALLGADRWSEEGTAAAFDEWRDDPPEGTVDLLLCTHGTRDVCCGGLGAATYTELRERLGGTQPAHGGPGERGRMRIWRSSHAGGHRFAPTGISLPDGHSWAHLDAALAEQILRREGDVAPVAARCRGSVTVDGAPAQMADREALAVHGWRWLEAERHAVVVAHERDTLATTVEVLGRPADGGIAGVIARVELDRHIAMPTCGALDRPELTTEPVWRAADVKVIGRQ